MDEIVLAQAVNILKRMGKSGDPAGVLSLFAHLQRIYEVVDQVEGYTDTLETTVNAIKPKTDLIGAVADAAGTATLFALLKKLDAKSGYDPFAMTNNITIYTNAAALPNIATGGVSANLVAINGKGILNDFKGFNSNTTMGFELVVDGIVLNTYSWDGVNTVAQQVVLTGSRTVGQATPPATVVSVNSPITFDTSLAIRIKNFGVAVAPTPNTIALQLVCSMV